MMAPRVSEVQFIRWQCSKCDCHNPLTTRWHFSKLTLGNYPPSCRCEGSAGGTLVIGIYQKTRKWRLLLQSFRRLRHPLWWLFRHPPCFVQHPHATLWLPTPSPAAVWVRACRRQHLLPREKFRLHSYFGCPARSSFGKNFSSLGQWVVERKSRDETRIRLPIWVSSITRVQPGWRFLIRFNDESQ